MATAPVWLDSLVLIDHDKLVDLYVIVKVLLGTDCHH